MTLDELPTEEDLTYVNRLLEHALKPRANASEYRVLFNFEDALELILTANPFARTGEITLHTWQCETLMFLSQKEKFTKQAPLKYLLRAANGSGKDAFVIAPFAVWFCCCKIRSRIVITSASHQQLSTQTEPNIKYLCERLNILAFERGLLVEGVDQPLFIIKRSHIVCTTTGSEIILFTTDEPGRAEGYHPWPDYPKGELLIITNEAKTVPDDIFNALSRCTYTHWLEISSPGHTSGHFYNAVRKCRDWTQGCIPGQGFSRKVTSYDCEHISKIKIEEDRLELGENHPVFRSKHLAEFTSVGEPIVIPKEWVDKCVEFAKENPEFVLPCRRAGVDLAGGGDENVLVVVEGNKVIAVESFICSDTDQAVVLLGELFVKWNLRANYICADDGGLGQGMLDNLRKKGWSVNRVRNQWPAIKKDAYGNRGAELWFNLRRLIEACLIVLPKDNSKLLDQLSSRYYKQHDTNGKIVLESKQDARANGHGSPDRADALALAFCGLTAYDFTDPMSIALLKANGKLAGRFGAGDLRNEFSARPLTQEHLAELAKAQGPLGLNKTGVSSTEEGVVPTTGLIAGRRVQDMNWVMKEVRGTRRMAGKLGGSTNLALLHKKICGDH